MLSYIYHIDLLTSILFTPNFVDKCSFKQKMSHIYFLQSDLDFVFEIMAFEERLMVIIAAIVIIHNM